MEDASSYATPGEVIASPAAAALARAVARAAFEGDHLALEQAYWTNEPRRRAAELSTRAQEQPEQ